MADERRAQAILNALSDEQPEVRAAAIRGVQSLELTPDAWREIMLANLQQEDDAPRLAVINAVQRHPDRLLSMKPDLSELLLHDSDGVAEHAAFLLQELGPDAIPSMLDALKGDRARVKQIGHAISLMGTAAVEHLMKAMDASDPRIRRATALALGSIRPVSPETVVALGEGLDDPDPATQEAFLVSIGNLGMAGREAAPPVRQKLSAPEVAVRGKAIEVLFRISPRDRELVQQLTAMIDDVDAEVRCQAMDTLRAVGPLGRQALPNVIDQLASESTEVRQSAAAFIGSHGSAAGEAVPALTAMLQEGDVSWRLTVATTLGQLGSAARPAFDKLSDLLEDPEASIRSASVEAVGNLGLESDALIPYLAKVLNDPDQQVRNGALRIVRRIGEDGIVLVPEIIPLAANEDERRGVLRVLERLERSQTRPESIPELGELLDHSSVDVQRLAIRFLGLAGPSASDSLPSIRALQNHSDEEIRSEAESAISKIESPTG